MSSRAMIGGPRVGVAQVPSLGACGWDETFDDVDFAAFKARYPAPIGGTSWNNNLSPGAESDYIEISGGRLLVHGLGDGSVYGFSLSPGVLPHPRELWYRCEVEMIGGAYDAPLETNPFLLSASTHGFYGDEPPPSSGEAFVQMYLIGSPQTQNPVDHFPNFGNVWTLFSPDGTDSLLFGSDQTSRSSVSDIMSVGAHTLILCASDGGSSYTCEFWYDPAPGDPPVATTTRPKIPGESFRFHQTQVNGPAGAGKTLAFGRIQIACGSRASDPFAIL